MIRVIRSVSDDFRIQVLRYIAKTIIDIASTFLRSWERIWVPVIGFRGGLVLESGARSSIEGREIIDSMIPYVLKERKQLKITKLHTLFRGTLISLDY